AHAIEWEGSRMRRIGRAGVALAMCLALSLSFAVGAPSAACAVELKGHWIHANAYSLKSTSSRSFKLKVDVWDLDVTKGKQYTFSGRKKTCNFYVCNSSSNGGYTKVSYKTFAKYIARRPGAVTNVRYKWRKNSKGKKYRYATTVWADGFARAPEGGVVAP
ncbi:MAG TPA: hypothetical protein VFG89_02460, partial [Coriobacteriia bacterium]|nr:hypothetical protein [Coriobacteriia bacterium]